MKMIIMRKQDENLSRSDDITVQISTASAQLEVNAYKRQAMVKMVVEQAKPEGCKSKSAQINFMSYTKQAIELGEDEDEFENEDQTEQDEENSQSTCLDVEAALCSTNFL